MYFHTLDKKECCGCTACLSACPRQCISMERDEEGFLYPMIDKAQCVNCGLCEKVCPMNHPVYENKTQAVYAAYIRDEQQRMKSTSGGIFYAIARWIIEQGGIVYGAAFDDDFKLKHIGVDSLGKLQKLRGSKYLQSDLGNVFCEIKEHLTKNRWVYFVGVGCQVAGLHSFLRKKYKTLITSDLVCHGVPSQLMFDWHLNYLRAKEKAEITSYSFRDCEGWGGCETYSYSSLVQDRKGTRKLHSYSLSPYLYSFMCAYTSRYSCYDCKFARIPRQGDVTLADYWGASNYFPELDCTKGVSLVLINNKIGNEIWDAIKCYLEYRSSCVDDAAIKNGNLIHGTKMPEFRKSCYTLINQKGYQWVAEHEFRVPHYWLIKLKVFLLRTELGVFLVRLKRAVERKKKRLMI